MQLQGAIFDLDGTLGDTLPVCYQAFRYVFEQFQGKTYSDAEIANMFGPAEKGIFQKRIPDQWELAWRAFLERYSFLHPQYGKKFSGIERALDLLRDNTIPLGIVTGKGKESAEISLEHLGLVAYFSVLEAGDDERGVKPDAIRRILKEWKLPGEKVIYVGDLTYDIRSAREAGVIPIAAGWSNTQSQDELLSEEPCALFSSVEEFIEWLVNEAGLSSEG
jgi:phosphoglycolate phosphatase-like HAD superfamily hydrolase